MDNIIYSLLNENAKILNILRCYPEIDKTSIMKLMETSWPTLTNAIRDLKEYDILSKEKDFEINSSLGYYVGISVGGAQIKVTFIDFNFQVISQEEMYNIISDYGVFSNTIYKFGTSNNGFGYFYFNTPSNFSELYDYIESILNDIIYLDSNGLNILGIGFAFTGAIDSERKIIIKSHNIEFLRNISFDTLIPRNIINYFRINNINIAFEHNAKSTIVAEKFALYNNNSKNYEFHNCSNIACVYLGSGIGLGNIFSDKLYKGSSFSGELGHIRVPSLLGDRTPTNLDQACSCGSTECLEYRIRTDVFEMTLEDFKKSTGDDLREKISKNKEEKLLLLSRYIGYIMNLIINLLDVDLIIFTGKLTTFLDDSLLWKYITDEKIKMNLDYTNVHCSLVSSNYGALAPSIGAAICSSYINGDSTIEWY